MNPYQFECTCSVCGGPGVGTGRTMAAEWTGGVIQHNDPRVCQYYIEKRNKEQQERIAELEAQVNK